MRRIWMSLATFVVAVVGPWAGAAAPLVSPAAGTDTVLALRAAPSGELRLEYQKDSGRDSPQTVSVGIASTYHYLRTGTQTRLYDYQLRRIFLLDGGGAFVNNSLYADVWYRAMELRNRIMLSAMLSKAGIKAPADAAGSNEPFYMEADLGVISKDLPRPDLKQVTEHDRVKWLYKDGEVAAVRYDKKEVPLAIQGGLRRFWTTFAQLHPDIADALSASKRMPTELWLKETQLGKDPVVAHWKLTQSKWEAAAPYPLPSHLAAHPALDTGVYPEIFATLNADVAEKRVPPAQDAYISKAETAIGKEDGLEALLWLIEMGLAQGYAPIQCVATDPRPYCALAARAGPIAKRDPRMAVAFAQKAPDEADRSQFDALPNAYMLRLLWSTRPPGKEVKRDEGERDLLAALRASPVANFCKDTGDFYAQGWQPFAAWQAWDLGRQMAGHTADDLLSNIDTLETNLAAGEHALF